MPSSDGYDPLTNDLEVWLRQDQRLHRMSHLKGWTSPRLGIRFSLSGETLEIYSPEGQPFLTSVQLADRMRQETARAELEAARAEQEAARAEQEHQRAERLADRLRALGIEP